MQHEANSNGEISDSLGATLCLRELLEFYLPRLKADETPPAWPPDLFALCMGVVSRWGLYPRALEDWPPPHSPTAKWVSEINHLGSVWRKSWLPTIEDPAAWWSGNAELRSIAEKWKALLTCSQENSAYFTAHSSDGLAATILELAAVADQASAGFGISPQQLLNETTDCPEKCDLHLETVLELHFKAEFQLNSSGGTPEGSTLCQEIHPSRLRVLPKMHTPQSGLTVRSLSHHLALLEASEIKPSWLIPDRHPGGGHLNLLLIPSPEKVSPADFSGVDREGNREMRNMPTGQFGFFTYAPAKSSAVSESKLAELVASAEREIGRIHTVILPELALDDREFRNLTRKFFSMPLSSPNAEREQSKDSDGRGPRSFVIAGVRSSEKAESGTPRGTNQVAVAYRRRDDEEDMMSVHRQSKHHRWKLDATQIRQYGLGSRLDPERQWWEHISVCDRRLNFLALQPWLVLSVLICEDLARPDPVGDLVRAVGPNLVIALLMDGPQIRERWPARYATTLADDPGSSVLSITSIGMSKLSRSRSGISRGRVVALWRGAKADSVTEIELPVGADALVLTLTRRYAQEWTADGRGDGNAAGYPELSGIHAINSDGIL